MLFEISLTFSEYLMFGGFNHDDVVTDGVYLIEVDIDNNISVSCNHSTLPKKLKESHAYEFQGTVHLENLIKLQNQRKRHLQD